MLSHLSLQLQLIALNTSLNLDYSGYDKNLIQKLFTINIHVIARSNLLEMKITRFAIPVYDPEDDVPSIELWYFPGYFPFQARPFLVRFRKTVGNRRIFNS